MGKGVCLVCGSALIQRNAPTSGGEATPEGGNTDGGTTRNDASPSTGSGQGRPPPWGGSGADTPPAKEPGEPHSSPPVWGGAPLPYRVTDLVEAIPLPRERRMTGKVVLVSDAQTEPIRLTWVWLTLLLVLPVLFIAAAAATLVLLLPLLVILVLLTMPFRFLGNRNAGQSGWFDRTVNIAGLFLPPRVRTERTIDTLPFRVEVDGHVVQCLLRGLPRGGSIELGDDVELLGRWSRLRGGSAFKVRRAVNTSSGSSVHGWLPASVRLNDFLRIAVPILVGILIAVAITTAPSSAS